MLFVALLLSSTLLFAQSNSPLEKGKYFGEKLVEYSVEEGDLDALADQVEKYMDKYVKTEQDILKFLEGIEIGVYKGCEKYELPEEVAALFMDMLLEAVLEATGGY